MKVLIATSELQGMAPGDDHHALDGELVTPVVVECADGERCGCRRGFPGLGSTRPTTTAIVVDRPALTPEDLRDAIADSLERDGWLDLLRDGAEARGVPDPEHDSRDAFEEIVDEHLEAIEAVCAVLTCGTVVERSGSRVAARSMPHAA